MQLIFQIPIIDLRQLSQTVETINPWPAPDMSQTQVASLMNTKPFVRNFGKIANSVEGYYCNINCMKFWNLGTHAFLNEIGSGKIFNKYKRLYQNSNYTLRAEIGFSDLLENKLVRAAIPEKIYITDILSHYTSMLVGVQFITGLTDKARDELNNDSLKHWEHLKLGGIGERLAENYANSTSKNSKQPKFTAGVTSGELAITMTYVANEKLVLPANAEKIDEFTINGTTVYLYGYKWNSGEENFKVWLFQLQSIEAFDSQPVVEELKRRRSQLFRLSAEKETLLLMMNKASKEDVPTKAKKYLKKAPIKIFKKKRPSDVKNNVRNFALQSDKSKMEFATINDLKKLLDDYGFANLKNLTQGMKSGPAKKTILFITSSPTDINPFDFGEHFKRIEEAWKSGTDRDYFEEPLIKTAVERDKVMEILYTKMPDFLHINLHASQINGLYFQNSKQEEDPMSADEFADYLKQLKELKAPEAVILCACNSIGHAKAVKDYCKYAMGTNYVFPEPAGIVYASKFYTALFNGKEVEFCHKVAIQGIKYNNPPFDNIDTNEVYKIPELIYTSHST